MSLVRYHQQCTLKVGYMDVNINRAILRAVPKTEDNTAPEEVQLVLNSFQKIQKNAISATEETVERILQVLYELQRRAQITLAFTIKQWEKKKEDDDNTNKNEMKKGDDGFGGLLDAIFKPKAPKGPILSAKEIIAAAAQKRRKATSTAATTASTATFSHQNHRHQRSQYDSRCT